MINFILHETQKKVAKSKARFITLVAGRRWGKSSLALALAITQCTQKANSKVWIIAPTFQQAKDIYWRSSEKIPFWMREFTKGGYIVKKNDSELLIQFPNGSVLQLKGSDREDTLRGSGLSYVIMDEVASMKANIWNEVIMPSLLDSGGKALFISTPMGFNHFYDLWKRGEDGIEDWESFQFTSYDNPHLDRVLIDQAKLDTPDDIFAQEYLAKFTKYSGLIYTEFERKIHVIEPIELPDHWTYGIGVDRGITNPSSAMFVAIDGDNNYYVYDEIYQTGLTSDKLLDQIRVKKGNRNLTYRVCDPAAKDFIVYCQQNDFHIEGAVREGRDSVMEGISKMKELLKVQSGTGKPRLFVFSNCKNLINEFEQYRWRPRNKSTDGQTLPDEPDKQYGFDHALDGLRYLITSIPVSNDNFDYALFEQQNLEEMEEIARAY